MYMLSIFLPLLSFLITISMGIKIGKKGSSLITNISMFVTFILSLCIFYEVCLCHSVCNIEMFDWVLLGFFKIKVGLWFDPLVSVMLLVVVFVSFLVHIYSVAYMEDDPGYPRFTAYLSLFTFFMLLLVSADNYVQMFVGWEGVGLSSYLLINFWYTRILANKAAVKAMVVNRIGDLALLLAIASIFILFGSLDYAVVFSLVNYLESKYIIVFGYEVDMLLLICLLLFIGAMGKSAQLGLHMWLPDAMEGPTPVSALIHAATMVTAGVFVVIRNSYLFESSEKILFLVAIIGGLTCLFTALIGMFQYDIKKIVAYSTCSQLGYMFFACGLSNYFVSIFHLFNHAFFKALLFLSMGAIIHSLCDEQDLRKMGGLLKLLPFTYVMVVIGSLALMGIPFLTGYYSKDFLLEFAYSRYNINSSFIYILGILAAFCTAFYSMRLLYWVFLAKSNMFKNYWKQIHESSNYMLVPMCILGISSIFVGYIFYDLFLGMGSVVLSQSIFLNITNYSVLDAEFSLFYVKYIALGITLLGMLFFFISLNIFEFTKRNKILIKVTRWLGKAYYFDLLYNKSIMKLLSFSYKFEYRYVEKGIFELFGPYLSLTFFQKMSFIFRKLDIGLIYYYIFFIILSILMFYVFIEIFCFWSLEIGIFPVLIISMILFFKSEDE